MNTSEKLRHEEIRRELYPTKTQIRADNKAAQTNLTRLYFGAVIGAAGGFLAGIVGLTLKAVAWIEAGDAVSQSINLASTALLVAMFSLWALCAYFLDKIEQAEKARRIEYCRKNGLSDKECSRLDDKLHNEKLNS